MKIIEIPTASDFPRVGGNLINLVWRIAIASLKGSRITVREAIQRPADPLGRASISRTENVRRPPREYPFHSYPGASWFQRQLHYTRNESAEAAYGLEGVQTGYVGNTLDRARW